MPINAARVTVTTAITRLDDTSDLEPHRGGSIAIKNTGASSIFLGDETVTTSTGWEIESEESLAFDLDFWSEVYAVTATGTSVAQLLQVRE